MPLPYIKKIEIVNRTCIPVDLEHDFEKLVALSTRQRSKNVVNAMRIKGARRRTDSRVHFRHCLPGEIVLGGYNR